MGWLGIVVAFAVGYVLGAYAGRDRYEEFAALAHKLLGDNPTQLPPRDERGRFVPREGQA